MAGPFLRHRLELLEARRRLRGFTLVELMVVVVIIAILATIAVPMFVARMRERRSQQSALQIAGVYREARMRALGRGTAVLVRFDGSSFQVREGVEGADAFKARTGKETCQSLPTRGCTSNAWGDATSRRVGGFDPSALTDELSTKVSFGEVVDSLDVCFTPLGRSFVRKDDEAWATLSSVVSIDVALADSGRNRTVLVLPNGTARLGL